MAGQYALLAARTTSVDRDHPLSVVTRTSNATARTTVSPARSCTTTPSSASHGPKSRFGPLGQFAVAHASAAVRLYDTS